MAVVTIPSDLSDHHSSSSRAQPAEVAGNVPSVELAIGHAGHGSVPGDGKVGEVIPLHLKILNDQNISTHIKTSQFDTQ